MKNLIVLILLFVFAGASTVKAQGIIDKANNLLNKADNASSTANRAGGTSDKVLGIFKKKKKVDAAATAPANALTGYKTVITIKGITMENLRKLNANVKACAGVDSTKMKFSGTGSIILVAHAHGSTEDLLTALEKTSKAIFTDKNIEGMEDGKIDIAR
ncbi:hypothetical protein SAMN05421821_11645 [Mucilaginibacter lappiensis]|uniref:Uncharacterized protein n=1 Tax=Mucilaginibacter lappiensis TaxID=354630 RepID=A0ABR6PQX2_9SPHI|nr:hypothetical protein [Mucilaginibacter lappiensis]MBB6112135.1 hypothetical protein [Mucilaginibacter lappiensis]SIR93958.1 hypothetical protein SAMN05421821_11645 [Mucilaginibacter lappiensis]